MTRGCQKLRFAEIGLLGLDLCTSKCLLDRAPLRDLVHQPVRQPCQFSGTLGDSALKRDRRLE
jgi:hypothetical protein